MEIQFVKHSELNKEKWNHCIKHSFFPTFFTDFDFLSIANPDFCALILNDYEAVMPLPVRKKMFLPYIYQPHFVSVLGIFSKTHPTKELIERFLQDIPKHYVRVDLIFNMFFDLPKTSVLHSYQLSLQKKYEEIYAKFSDNCRRNIKSSEKFALKYVENRPIAEIIALFKNNRGKNTKVPFAEKDYEILQNLAHFAQKSNHLEVIAVLDADDKMLAGALLFKDEHKTWFWFSGRDEECAEKKAMFFLLNEYFKRNAETATIFDFHGSMNPNIARFNAGFGAEKYEVSMLKKRLF
ncbi:MAG: GNAT family N-acetyltransferase [Bacteroidetes bacterium]|nr:GNAT family N-acetyltransferase [Bacteroidota bacterium]MCL2303131.1 GNAT family N-acetyltransferase [Lentimicrobiaceae bacterium]